MKPVLHDIRVLDLGRFISAPYCGMILAAMGAEVIRVERPGGEEDRRIGLTGPGGENLTYPNMSRGKKGITLDLMHVEGRRILGELVTQCDVLCHNFSPGAARAMGLGYDDLRVWRPDLIHAAISCYGPDGPQADRTGFDPIAQTSSGAASVTGMEGDDPLRCGVPWVDYSTGLSAALGIVLALRHRDATGEGQAVDCALLQTAVSYMAPVIAEAVVLGRDRPRLGNRVPYVGPSDLYRCCDGFVFVACATEASWRSLMRLIGRPELIEHPDLRSQESRFEHRARIDPAVAVWIGERTVAEVLGAMEAARIPCGVHHSPGEVPDDPQVAACEMLLPLDLDVPGLERVPHGALPLRLSRTPAVPATRGPRIGEHNHDVYRRLLGYSDARIAELEASRII